MANSTPEESTGSAAAAVTRRGVMLGLAGTGAGVVVAAFGLNRSNAHDAATPVASEPPPGDTPAPTESPTAVPAVTGVDIASTPDVALDVASGPAGTAITAVLAGYQPRERVTLKWFHGSRSTTIGSVTLDSAGEGTKRFFAPESVRGGHKITAKGNKGGNAETSFTITPLIAVDPAMGEPGTRFILRASGFAASVTLELRWFAGGGSDDPFTVIATKRTSTKGSARKTLAIPGEASGGAHRIDAHERGGSTTAATTVQVIALDLEQHLAIPAYFYPGPLWPQMNAAAPVVGLAVMNPASGPGESIDSTYVEYVATTQQAGITVIGYVDTSYASIDLETAKTNVDAYYDWYSVNGIFFDQASNDCGDVDYYQELFNYVKAKDANATVAINPGTTTSECYMDAADIVLTFESNASDYEAYVPAGWESGYPPERFWHLIYNVDAEADMQSVVQRAKNLRAGWIYVTPDNLPNPWDTLPSGSYWTAELASAS